MSSPGRFMKYCSRATWMMASGLLRSSSRRRLSRWLRSLYTWISWRRESLTFLISRRFHTLFVSRKPMMTTKAMTVIRYFLASFTVGGLSMFKYQLGGRVGRCCQAFTWAGVAGARRSPSIPLRDTIPSGGTVRSGRQRCMLWHFAYRLAVEGKPPRRSSWWYPR